MAYRKVGYAEYSTRSETGDQANGRDTRRSTVTVYYRPIGRSEHTGISRKEFIQWESAGWNPTYCPKGIELQTMRDDEE
jgi:hypothetical protein